MSSYVSVHGHIQYENKEAYENVVTKLYNLGFLSEDHPNCVDRDGDWYESDQAILNPRDFIIYIPWGMYDRFHIVVPLAGVKDINLVIICTDGETCGWYYNNKKNKWIIKEFKEIDKDIPDSEIDEQNYFEWEQDCCDYFDKFLRPTPEYVPNSVDYFTKEEEICKPKRKSSPIKKQKKFKNG